jgi:hypothetical protein
MRQIGCVCVVVVVLLAGVIEIPSHYCARIASHTLSRRSLMTRIDHHVEDDAARLGYVHASCQAEEARGARAPS